MAAVAPMPARAAPPGHLDGAHARAPAAPLDVTYVDEARTHHVHARVVTTAGRLEFHISESTFERAQPEDVLHTRIPIRDAWEARFHQADLEGRLGQMGRYWRHHRGGTGWVALRPHPGVPRVDLRPVEWHDPQAVGVEFHQFHRVGQRDQLLVTLPRQFDGVGRRWLLADLEFEFPRATAGTLRILHERLPPGPLRSLLTREHVERARGGFDKINDPREYALRYGPEWRDLMREAFTVVVERIHARRVGDGAPTTPIDRDDGFATDFGRILHDPRLHAVHRRFLTPQQEDALLDTNAVQVRRWVGARRRVTRHDDQHLLSLVEASLLARLALRRNAAVDATVAQQLKRLAFYL